MSQVLTNIHHVGIVVNEMERSLVFYRDLLGLKVISDSRAFGKEMDVGVGLKNVQLRVVYLQTGNTRVELLQYYSPPSKPLSTDARANDIGVGHLAFITFDIEKAYTWLSEKGVKFLSRPQTDSDGSKWVYFQDPDGAILEFVQLPEKL